jgi:hypothetical protein
LGSHNKWTIQIQQREQTSDEHVWNTEIRQRINLFNKENTFRGLKSRVRGTYGTCISKSSANFLGCQSGHSVSKERNYVERSIIYLPKQERRQ